MKQYKISNNGAVATLPHANIGQKGKVKHES
nr:MAG TPA: hypothetical protein [Caudoviricetes sp.]